MIAASVSRLCLLLHRLESSCGLRQPLIRLEEVFEEEQDGKDLVFARHWNENLRLCVKHCFL